MFPRDGIKEAGAELLAVNVTTRGTQTPYPAVQPSQGFSCYVNMLDEAIGEVGLGLRLGNIIGSAYPLLVPFPDAAKAVPTGGTLV